MAIPANEQTLSDTAAMIDPSYSGLAKVGIILAGCLILFVALKIGNIILKILTGLVGLALLGGAIWLFLANH